VSLSRDHCSLRIAAHDKSIAVVLQIDTITGQFSLFPSDIGTHSVCMKIDILRPLIEYASLFFYIIFSTMIMRHYSDCTFQSLHDRNACG
jgi:hypothetical protein